MYFTYAVNGGIYLESRLRTVALARISGCQLASHSRFFHFILFQNKNKSSFMSPGQLTASLLGAGVIVVVYCGRNT